MPAIRTTSAVRWLLVVSVALFLIQLVGDAYFGTRILEFFGLVPALFFESHRYWQAVTYIFMHADLFHILFNLLILWMIGSELEAQWGTREFLRYFFVCGISAGLIYLGVQGIFRGSALSGVPMVGSSGAVYGLLVAYGIIYSERTMLFMMVFPMKAKHFVLILAAIEFVATVFYTRSGIANAAHLGGIVVGFGYLVLKAYLRIRSRRKGRGPGARRRFRPSYLRLIVNNDPFKDFDSDDDSQDGRPTFH